MKHSGGSTFLGYCNVQSSVLVLLQATILGLLQHGNFCWNSLPNIVLSDRKVVYTYGFKHSHRPYIQQDISTRTFYDIGIPSDHPTTGG